MSFNVSFDCFEYLLKLPKILIRVPMIEIVHRNGGFHRFRWTPGQEVIGLPGKIYYLVDDSSPYIAEEYIIVHEQV